MTHSFPTRRSSDLASECLKPPTPPNWIVDGIAETDSFCVLFGDPESGKSFMAMDWACCVATGTPWKDRKVKKGPVLYINGEGHNGVNRRLTAWAIANGVDLRQHPLYLSSTPTALTDERSEARRGGKEGVSPFRSGGCRYK